MNLLKTVLILNKRRFNYFVFQKLKLPYDASHFLRQNEDFYRKTGYFAICINWSFTFFDKFFAFEIIFEIWKC